MAKLYAYWITINYREAYNIFGCNGILFNHESPRRGDSFATKKIVNSIDVTQSNNLKKNEDKYGFNMGQKNKFFYLGGKNNWKSLLDPKIEKKIRDALLKEMKELEYI